MGSQTVMLDRKKLEALFAELDVELDRIDASAEVYVAGGARMAFGLSDGRVTSDVDAAFRKTEGPVGQALAAVAERNGLAPDWINSAMVGSAPTSADTGESTLYEGRRLHPRTRQRRHRHRQRKAQALSETARLPNGTPRQR